MADAIIAGSLALSTMPYVFPLENLFIAGVAALIFVLIVLRIVIARRRPPN